MKLQLALATVATAISTIGVIGVQSAEAFTIFTDRAAWEAALGGATITTDTFSNNKSNAKTIIFDSGVTSSANGDGFTTNQVFSGFYVGLVDGQGDNEFVFDTITWNFPQPITAFGADWRTTADGDLLTVTGNFDGTGDQTVSFFDVLKNPGDGFLGIIGEASFSTITLGTVGAGGPGEAFEADNLSFASSTPIPTPALLPSLVGMGIAALRQKRKGEASEQAVEPAEG